MIKEFPDQWFPAVFIISITVNLSAIGLFWLVVMVVWMKIGHISPPQNIFS